MRNLLASCALAVLGAACSDAPERAPAPGRYAYTASHPDPVTPDTVTFSGVLVIEESTPESIAGHWEVTQLQPSLERGGWEEDAYVAYAYPIYGGIAVHRISRAGGPRDLRCTGHYTWVAEGGVERDIPLTCQLSPLEPGATPATPAPGSRVIRPFEGRVRGDSTP
jgi:hypothetical protein